MVKTKTLFVILLTLTLCSITTLLLLVYSRSSHSLFHVGKPHSMKQLKPVKISKYFDRNPEQGAQNGRIFFHETSGANFLRQRKLCAVESAAYHHPARPVQLIMHTTSEPHLCSSWMEVIQQYPNIEIVLINETRFFADSPFQTIYATHFQMDERNLTRNRRLSEYTRLLTSSTGGGTYLDLDFMLLQPLDDDVTFFAFENNASSTIANHIYSLPYGHPFIIEMIDFISGKSKDLKNISAAMNHVIRKHCSKDGSINCETVKIYPYETFFPIRNDNAHINYLFFHDLVLKSDEPVTDITNSTIGVHLWDENSHYFPITYDSDFLVTALAKRSCPLTVEFALRRSS